MDKYEGVGYTILGVIAFMYLIAMVAGFFAILPYGLVGLALLIAVGALLLKVFKERISNKEDDYYSKKVDK
ncbi:MAG: hypothetical protein K6L81_07235 [Agarilytica sp.]